MRLLLRSLWLVFIVPVIVAAQPNGPVASWTKQNAIPLTTVEAGHGFADMKPLDRVVGDARIVALGEATHGSREIFQLKHRLIEYLAAQKGFTIFSIEANMPEAYRLNDFVLNGNGDPKQLIDGMYFWTWNTQEVLDMVLWMREYNRSGKGHIEFTGFDMQTPTVAAEIVKSFVQQNDPAYLQDLSSVYKNATKGDPPAWSSGIAVGTFPLKVAAGKHITFSGYIRTENVKDGFAGLWWRVDGEPNTPPLVFDSMEGRAPKGTTPWTRYEISLDVPTQATRIDFGVIHSGSGKAWFDSLQVTIDGQVYNDPNSFDFDFESQALKGFSTAGDAHELRLDSTNPHSGAQSLRSVRTDSPSQADRAQIAQACKQVVARLESSRTKFIEEGRSPKEVEWAIQNARVVLQSAQMKSGERSRDESMADNVRWIAAQNPGAKIVLWAHNQHISKATILGFTPMGVALEQMFGAQYVNFGFIFNQGGFRAIDMDNGGLRDFVVAPAPPDTIEANLSAAGTRLFALDLRGQQDRNNLPSKVDAWLKGDHPTRSIGSSYSTANAKRFLVPIKLRDHFDTVLFLEGTTPARPIK